MSDNMDDEFLYDDIYEGDDTDDYDDYPQDTLGEDDGLSDSDLEYRERVVNDILNSIDDYLKFGTMSQVLKLIRENFE